MSSDSFPSFLINSMNYENFIFKKIYNSAFPLVVKNNPFKSYGIGISEIKKCGSNKAVALIFKSYEAGGYQASIS